MFDSDDAMVRIDMSEFMEKHSVARLIGAPRAMCRLRRGVVVNWAIAPQTIFVILLDKESTPRCFSIFLLQVLDDGRWSWWTGPHESTFRNTVVIMTSNLWALREFKENYYARWGIRMRWWKWWCVCRYFKSWVCEPCWWKRGVPSIKTEAHSIYCFIRQKAPEKAYGR